MGKWTNEYPNEDDRLNFWKIFSLLPLLRSSQAGGKRGVFSFSLQTQETAVLVSKAKKCPKAQGLATNPVALPLRVHMESHGFLHRVLPLKNNTAGIPYMLEITCSISSQRAEFEGPRKGMEGKNHIWSQCQTRGTKPRKSAKWL